MVVSGDGLLTEVANSLMRRPDAFEAIKIPMGVIPAGSGNGCELLAFPICMVVLASLAARTWWGWGSMHAP